MIFKPINIFFSGLFCCLITYTGFSQQYEIRAMEDSKGYIAVQIRDTVSAGLPLVSTDITDIQFGIRWPASYGTSVDVQLLCSDYHLVDGLDARQVTGSYYWRVFAADSVPFVPSQNWVVNQWETIGTFKVVGPTGPESGSFVIPADEWAVQGLNLGLEGADFSPEKKDSVVAYPFPTKVWDWVWKGGASPAGGYDKNSWTYGLNWENECGEEYDASFKPIITSNCLIQSGMTDYPENFNNFASGVCHDLKLMDNSNIEIPSGILLNVTGNMDIEPSATVIVNSGGNLNLEQPD